MSLKIRKIAVNIEETHREIGREISPATRKAVAVAVIENPFAGRYVEDLTVLMDIGAELGTLLGRKCVEALGITPAETESYGKSAMVGENGELEHAAAILHPKLGAPLRAEVEKGAALDDAKHVLLVVRVRLAEAERVRRRAIVRLCSLAA
jgi:hypothetical protein